MKTLSNRSKSGFTLIEALIAIFIFSWIGLGAYALLVSTEDLGLPLVVGIVMGGLVSAAFAYPTALLSFRLRGGYFAIGTWVIAEVLRLLISSSTDWLGGGVGRSLTINNLFSSASQRIMVIYLFAVLIAFGTVALSQYLLRSKTGLGLTSI